MISEPEYLVNIEIVSPRRRQFATTRNLGTKKVVTQVFAVAEIGDRTWDHNEIKEGRTVVELRMNREKP